MGLFDDLLGRDEERKSQQRQRQEAVEVGRETTTDLQGRESRENQRREDQSQQAVQQNRQTQQTGQEQTAQNRRDQTQDRRETTSRQRQEGTSRQDQERRGQESGSEQLERALQDFISSITKGTQRGTQRGDVTRDQTQSGTTIVESLDAESQQRVSDLLDQFTAEDTGIGGFVEFLHERARETEDEVRRENEEILAAVRGQGEREIGQQSRLLAQEAGGSTLNSLVQATSAELENDLAVQLAGLNSQLNQAARDAALKESDAVLKGFGIQSQAAADIANALIGSRQVTRSNQATGTTESQNVSSFLETFQERDDRRRTNEQVLNELQSYTTDNLESLIKEVQDLRRDDDTRGTSQGISSNRGLTNTQQFVQDFLNSMQNSIGTSISTKDATDLLTRVLDRDTTNIGVREGEIRDTTDVSRDANLLDIIDSLD